MMWVQIWTEKAQAKGAPISEDENRCSLMQTLVRLPE